LSEARAILTRTFHEVKLLKALQANAQHLVLLKLSNDRLMKARVLGLTPVDSTSAASGHPPFAPVGRQGRRGFYLRKGLERGPQKRPIDRAELALICLEELRLWPGCESVVSVGVLAAPSDRFALRVIEYGAAPIKRTDQALRAIERMKLREYSLKAS
jgi:hypothetical protein